MMNRFKIAAATVGVAAVSTLVPLGMAGTAHADTTADGCTVAPYAPTAGVQNGPSGRPMVRYKVDVTCVGGVDIEIRQEFWEQDLMTREGNWDDEYTGSETTNLNFAVAGTQSFTVREELPFTGLVEDGDEEVYQAVEFEVSIGVVGGGWTTPELTQPTTIFH
jgi:hypothetical protein